MPIEARRTFRLAISVTLSLIAAYGLAMPLPYLAPVLALGLGSALNAPIAAKNLIGLLLVVALCTSIGIGLSPLLINYPVSAILLVALILFLANSIAIGGGKALAGLLLTVGAAMISAAAVASSALAKGVIVALMTGVTIAVISHGLACLLLPELARDTSTGDRAPSDDLQTRTSSDTRWLAVRATLILMPAYFMVLVNPSAYMPLILKSANLGQQVSGIDARSVARELLLSTALAGIFAIAFWFVLKVCPSLWFFGLWTLLFLTYIGAKLHGALTSAYSPSFWQGVGIQMFILLGPAVQDSANGNDVYQAFIVRFSLFLVVTLYAVTAVWLLDGWRRRRAQHRPVSASVPASILGAV